MRICFFGDSFTNGTGDGSYLGWVGRVCAEGARQGVDLTAYNLGIRRDTSLDIGSRWRAEAKARLPQDCDGRLVFCFGANDAAQGLDIDRTLGAAEGILAQARGWLPTIMVGPPPVVDSPKAEAHLRLLSPSLAALCGRLDVPYLETFGPLSESRPWIEEAQRGDGAHPDAGGYGALARLVADWPVWRRWMGIG